MAELLFKTQGLSFSEKLRYENIEIPQNKITFFTGESGCGKSTLLRLFNASLPPAQGTVYYKGTDILSLEPTELRRKVLLVSQEAFLFDCNISENFKRFYEYRSLPCPPNEKLEYFLQVCGLKLGLDKDAAVMSGGERQRLYTAIFLSFAPETLLLDEPTSALDVQTGTLVMQNIVNHCKENHIELLVVSHDRALTERFSENTVVIGKQVL